MDTAAVDCSELDCFKILSTGAASARKQGARRCENVDEPDQPWRGAFHQRSFAIRETKVKVAEMGRTSNVFSQVLDHA
jgi:hypothetical protein